MAYAPWIRGAAIAAFLIVTMDAGITDPALWVSFIALNVAVNI